MIYRIVFILLFPVLCFGAPSISSVSTIRHGEPATIGGSGFGVKSTATPLVFENFDANDPGRQTGDTILGKNCSGYGQWDTDTFGDFTPVYTASNLRSENTGLSSYHYLDTAEAADPQTHADMWITFSENNVPALIVTFWCRLLPDTTGADDNVQIKTWRVLADNPAWNSDSYSNFSISWWSGRPVGALGLATLKHDLSSPTIFPTGGDTTLGPNLPDDGTWYQETLMMKQGTAGTATGSFKYWVYDWYYEDIGNILTYTANVDWERCLFGYFIGNDDNHATTAVIQYDDIYIDSSWQTVWIGNAPTWSSCTAREIQIQTTRTDTSIIIKVNQGGLSGDAWVYAMDAYGDVNDQGYPVTFDGAPAQETRKSFSAGGTRMRLGTQFLGVAQ